MTIWEAVLLGIVQGIFMFFPVSSTSHLALTQHWLISRGSALPAPDSAEMILFDLVVHVGTLVSIAVVFWPSLSAFVRQVWLGLLVYAGRANSAMGRLYVRLALYGLLSVFVTGLVGFPLKALFESVFASPIAISVTLVITGILLWWTDVLPPRPLGLRQIDWKVASFIGLAQGLALLPGLSRSGTTISFALFAGLKRRWAAEYSFFIAFPTILGASLLQSIEVAGGGGLTGIDATAMIVGFVVAALVGIVALKIVVVLLLKARLRFFSYYVWVLAAVVAFSASRGIL
jgi:undecaprenyl-diphosphatase